MKSKTLMGIMAITLAALAIPGQLHAQQPRYKLIDLGPFNGGLQSYVYIPPYSYAPVLNDAGMVAGWADTSAQDSLPFCFNGDCLVSHAFQWQNGARADLGALAANASSLSTWITANGLIAGASENGQIDSFSGFPEEHAVLWTHGRIRDLGTLDQGNQSAALAANSRGQVVGAATNCAGPAISLACPDDPAAMFADLFGWDKATRAFLWQNGVMQDLGTLGGSDAVALLVNERGQVAGASYTDSNVSPYCSNPNNGFNFADTTSAFLWENGEMKNLVGFGGTCTVPSDLNNRGEVVGISTLSGDLIQHAFLWDGSLHELPNTIGGNNASAIAINEGGDVVGWASVPGDQVIGDEVIHASFWKNGLMTDLGTVGTDTCSNGYSVNAAEQVVGISVASCDFSKSRAFLWQKGSMVDLNTLIPAGSTLYLTVPETINDRGEIAGVGVDSNFNEHAFLLIPCSANDTECLNAPSGPAFVPAPATAKPGNNQNNSIRRMFRRPLRPLNKIPDPRTSFVPSVSGITTTAATTGANATLSTASLGLECRYVIRQDDCQSDYPH